MIREPESVCLHAALQDGELALHTMCATTFPFLLVAFLLPLLVVCSTTLTTYVGVFVALVS